MSKKKTKPNKVNLGRKYQAEMLGLPSLQLNAAPGPQEELYQENPASNSASGWCSPEMIQHLIERIKSI